MSGRPWRVESRAPGVGPGSDWHRNYDYGFFATSGSAADAVRKWLTHLAKQGTTLTAEYRLVNRDTAEVIHVDGAR